MAGRQRSDVTSVDFAPLCILPRKEMASQPPFFPGDLDDHNEDEMHLENTMTRKRTRARPSTAPARGEDSQLRNP